MSKKPVVLIIMDGFGINERKDYNAIAQAKKPNLDMLMKTYPWKKGYASGLAVGLPDGQMGNSEVGHMNMGAGRIIYQELTRITKEIEDGEFFKNEALLAAVENCKEKNSALHLMGLLSDGGVHSHITHMYGLLELAKKAGLEKVYLHCFLDGRDTPPRSGRDFVADATAKMDEIGVGKVASVMGRYYAMDRDNRWDRVELAYKAMVYGEGNTAFDPVAAVENSYRADATDEFVVPTVIEKDGVPVGTIKNDDSIIFFNFRPDRAREISRAFCNDDFDGFERRGGRVKAKFVCFTDYDSNMPNKEVAFKKVDIKNTFGEYMSKLGKTQLRTAETEKYAHVTFFFNGGVEEPYPGEDRILVKSPKVATYDLQPEMSAYGTRALNSLDYILNKLLPDRKFAEPYWPFLIVKNVTKNELMNALDYIRKNDVTESDYIVPKDAKTFGKYNDFVPENLLIKQYVDRYTDVVEMKEEISL